MPSAVPAIKSAVFAALQTLYTAPTLVCYGDPGSNQPPEIIAVLDARVRIARPVAAPTRPREETTELDVLFSVWAPGGESQHQVASERAFALFAPFVDYFKVKPNETLGGACRNSWIDSYELTETNTYDPSSGAVTGQVSEVKAVLVALTRI